jgi:hypothetical protein
MSGETDEKTQVHVEGNQQQTEETEEDVKEQEEETPDSLPPTTEFALPLYCDEMKMDTKEGFASHS